MKGMQANLSTLTRNTTINVTIHIFQRYCCSKLWSMKCLKDSQLTAATITLRVSVTLIMDLYHFIAISRAEENLQGSQRIHISCTSNIFPFVSPLDSVCDLIFCRPLLIESIIGCGFQAHGSFTTIIERLYPFNIY